MFDMDSIVKLIAILFYKAGNGLIMLAAIVNLFIFSLTMWTIKRTEKEIHPPADKSENVIPDMNWSDKQILDLKKWRKCMIISYAFYANITAIFPLLGILGTVAALVTYSNETMMDNFMVALSTTLLGVFFAIVFKGLDALLSGSIDDNLEKAYSIIQKHDEGKRHN